MKRLSTASIPTRISVSCLLLTGILLVLSRAERLGEGDLFRRLEWVLYDFRMRFAAAQEKAASTNTISLAFVAVGDADQAAVLDGRLGYQFGLYWPRHVYGRAVRELRNEGAKAIAFDVMFYDLRPDHAPVKTEDGQTVSSDGFLAREFQKHGHVILAANRIAVPPGLFLTNAWSIGDVSTERDADAILRRGRAFIDYRVWHPAILQQAMALDFDVETGVIRDRRITFRQRDGGAYELERDPAGNISLAELTGNAGDPPVPPFTYRRVWQLGIVLASTELGLDLGRAEVDLRQGRIVIPGKTGAGRILRVDAHGRFLIDWTHAFSSATVDKESISALLARDVLRQSGETNGIVDRFKDKLVVIGSTATGNELADLGATPLDKETFLVSKHWNIALSLLSDRFVERAPLWIELVILVVLSAVSGVVTWKIERLWIASACVLAFSLAEIWASLIAFNQWRVWLPSVLPGVLGPWLVHLAITSYRVAFERKERQRVRSIFSQIVAPEVVQELLSAERLVLGGAQRHVTVFFADVRGFTEFTDTAQADAERQAVALGLDEEAAKRFFDQCASEALSTVNVYLGTIADTIKRHQGTLDKYIGDCVMAFWGAPAENPNHAACCVRAAIEVQRSILTLNQNRFAENERRETENRDRILSGQPPLPLLPLLKLGTGINAGKVTVGLMGSEAHILNYTVFGREVNLASRLEGVSGRDRIVISESTHKELLRTAPDLAAACVELPPVTVKGIRSEIRIFRVPWEPEEVPGGSALESVAQPLPEQ